MWNYYNFKKGQTCNVMFATKIEVLENKSVSRENLKKQKIKVKYLDTGEISEILAYHVIEATNQLEM